MKFLARSLPLWAAILMIVGVASATVVIFVRVEVPSTAYVTFSGTFQVTPSTFAFGNLAPGTSVTQAVVVKNTANRDLDLVVWHTLSGNPNLSLAVKNQDGTLYTGVRLGQGQSVTLQLVLSSPANAQSGEQKFTIGFDGTDTT